MKTTIKTMTKLFIASLFISPIAMADHHAMPDHAMHGSSMETMQGMQMDHSGHQMQDDKEMTAEFIEGEVKRVNLRDGKVTLKHGQIPSHQMPPMTMDFKVRDPQQLKGLKRGAKVKFRLNTQMEITQLQAD